MIVRKKHTLHQLVSRGDLQGVRACLEGAADKKLPAINAFDRNGYTPLMVAAMSPRADAEMIRLLVAHGAATGSESRARHALPGTVMSLALGGGDPDKVAALIAAGADLRYRRADNYDALIDAVHGRDVLRDPRLLDLLRLLIEQGVELSGITSYQESGLRVLSRLGRFDAVELLLVAGADAAQLGWTPLMFSIALGTLAEVEAELQHGAALEATDGWLRTAWLLAIQTGDLVRARLLHAHGANPRARGRCGKPPLVYAIENHHAAMLRWLLDIGLDVEEADDFGVTPLIAAAEADDAEAIEILLQAGADTEHENSGETALSVARSRAVCRQLLAAGANPQRFSIESRRALLGLPPDADEAALADVSAEEFARARVRRFGTANPDPMNEPFWQAMIRSGATAYAANKFFSGPSSSCGAPPVWCAHRFGQSITLLDDGRIVLIGGEHEDFYDPDFCIYNDVFVQETDGTVCIFGYPEAVFAPTDFHTATVLGDFIYIIGGLGYADARRYAETPVYRLDLRDLGIERLAVGGTAPGWLYGHCATPVSENTIRIHGGTIVGRADDKDAHMPNSTSYRLDTKRLVWQ